MDRAVANLRRFTGASLATAVRLASRNPARMLGLDNLTEVAVGRPANFNSTPPRESCARPSCAAKYK